MKLLPRTSVEAGKLARHHDERLKHALMMPKARLPYRHAFEVRHSSYFNGEFYALLRAYGHAFVIADTAGTFSYAEEITSDWVYVRLHGSRELYAS